MRNLPPRVLEALERVRTHGRQIRRTAVMLVLDRGHQDALVRLAADRDVEIVSVTSDPAMALQLVHDRMVRAVLALEPEVAYGRLVAAAGGVVIAAVPAGRIRPIERTQVGTTPHVTASRSPGRRIQPVAR